jgi:two-component system response regulator BaeR
MTSATNPQLILIVEDEPKIANVLVDYLKAAGFDATCLFNGLEVSTVVREKQPSLILLDLLLPGRNGLEVCRELRTFTNIPIIMVTALVEEIDRLLGLEIGADDYICKPFSPREVVARVKTVLRRPVLQTGTKVNSQQVIGPFIIDEDCMRISYFEQKLDFTVSEFRLLHYFLKNPGRVYSREQLLIALHGTDDESFDRAIDTHIKNIRKKLSKISPNTNVLRSVYGVGYQLDLD